MALDGLEKIQSKKRATEIFRASDDMTPGERSIHYSIKQEEEEEEEEETKKVYDWCTKGRGMCYPVCGMVHIKEPLL